MTTAADVRHTLTEALQLDLVGPEASDRVHATEILPQAPSKWYLTGFLAPSKAPPEGAFDPRFDDWEDEAIDQVGDPPTSDDAVEPEIAAARKVPFPASMGVSFLVAATVPSLAATVTWGDYQPVPLPTDDDETRQLDDRLGWQRIPRRADCTFALAASPQRLPSRIPLIDGAGQETGLALVVTNRAVRSPDLPPGTRSVSVFVVNERNSGQGWQVAADSGGRSGDDGGDGAGAAVRQPLGGKRSAQEQAFVFQVRLELICAAGFIPRSDVRGAVLQGHRALQGHQEFDADEAIAYVQYRHDYEYAVGHNVSVIAVAEPHSGQPHSNESRSNKSHSSQSHPDKSYLPGHLSPGNLSPGNPSSEHPGCTRIATTWIPTAEVPRVEPSTIPDVELGMEHLANAITGQDLQAMLRPLVTAYGHWLQQQGRVTLEGDGQAIVQDLLKKGDRACRRLEAGIKLFTDPQRGARVLEAFRIANRGVAQARRQQWSQETQQPASRCEPPAWRPFQLAFILLNLPGMADPQHGDRAAVDLLFFPTGGGKTEAYLGLAAFAIALRRLQHPGITGAGVSVLMRYTLRLLTLDQLERASRLICALELERRQHPQLGSWPFEIGLWVGQSATPNRMGAKGDKNDPQSARARTLAFTKDSKGKPSPIPLERCPWCGTALEARSFQLVPSPEQPRDLQIHCPNRRCEFGGTHALPIVAVDECLYRRLPCFIIATVDKFANLPWVGQTAALFGRVSHYRDGEGFSGAADDPPIGTPLPAPLPPPDLVIQDELHLISGPLGTMVGLYEAAIDQLCTRTDAQGRRDRPKIIASTATVRRAQQQIQALFGRSGVDIFPPPGPDRHDSFFAKTVPVTETTPGRLYVGVAAQGRSLKVVLLRTYLALLAAAQKAWNEAAAAGLSPNPADPYMTLLGYFNSLRELGGSRRIVEDEVTARLATYGDRRCRWGETQGLFANRNIHDDPEELTSRVSTNKVAGTKRCLALDFSEKNHVDVALATNMISVGLDIIRLGLMVVLGQPKTAAEYIQATSRVGRDRQRPGLVVTLLNVHRPRDRSHYERFPTWHASFYRAVEATSVTPFSPRALDRGLAGVVVALARLGLDPLTPPLGASAILDITPAEREAIITALAERAEGHNTTQQSAHDTEAIRQEVKNRVNDLLDAWQQYAHKEKRLRYSEQEGKTAAPLLLDAFGPQAEHELGWRKKFRAQRSLRDVEPSVPVLVPEVAQARPQGELRQSQLLTTFGPGAMVDLPDHSVVIAGLSFWKGERQVIVEERLRAKIAKLLGVPDLKLHTPPQAGDQWQTAPAGIDAFVFPTWFVAQVEETFAAHGKLYRTRPLLTWDSIKGGRGFNGQRVAMVPVRFVQACVHGHLSDLDWHRFVQHRGRCRGQLWLDEGGSGNDFEEIFVRCEICEARRPLAQAKVPDSPVLGPCQGDRPWLGDRDPAGCHHHRLSAEGELLATEKPEYNRLLVRSASNAYFSQVLSVISIPDSNAELNEALNPFYDGDLEDEESAADLAKTLRKSKYQALAEFGVAAVWAAIQQRQSGQSEQGKSIKALELEALMNCPEELGTIAPNHDANFDGRTRPTATIADRWRPWIDRIVLVHRLREVSAQVGFTRFEAVIQNTEGELDDLAIAVRRAALAAEPTWVPAIAHKGEGIFIALARDKVNEWLDRKAVQKRGQQLIQSFQQWRDRRGIRGDSPPFPGLPYVMLHSLSHLLITAVSLDCGYAASAIRERIYAYETGYGILLHTGSAGSEGTLGGLVAVGRQIERHLDRALALGRLCSNDPVCAQHQPTDPREDRFLHGAACHGCLLIAETSCERRNELLDRALVVETVAGLDAAFFRDEGMAE